jgi:2-C-methyl-D-erythritol 2,4-cyclodiphosphate synthase
MLLAAVGERVRAAGFEIVNIDCTIIAQAPRMGSHKAQMASNIAACLRIGPDRVNVKAKTTEHLGFLGRGEGIAALAVALVESRATRNT